jgi:hypothetical protein
MINKPSKHIHKKENKSSNKRSKKPNNMEENIGISYPRVNKKENEDLNEENK